MSAFSAEQAMDELGLLDRRKVNRIAKGFRGTEDPLALREYTQGLEHTSPLRRVVGLHYVAAHGLELANAAVPSERSRRVGSMLLSLQLSSEDRLVSQRTLLTPGILRSFSRAGAGYFTGEITSGNPGISVGYKNPLAGYPDDVKGSAYLGTAAKYWMLGGAARDIMWGQPSADNYLQHLPDAQRPLFQSLAEEIDEIRGANFMGRFEKLRKNRARQQTADAITEPVNHPELNLLQDIVAGVDDEGCVKTLESLDARVVSQAITDIRDMREANPGITDRKVYLTFRNVLDHGLTTMDKDKYETLTETVTILNLLLGGKVSKDAAFPPGI